MLIVFDTCTKPDYYKDVHKVLAAPTGTLVRYDYERRLWSPDAESVADQFSINKKPVPALLVYGQLKSYRKGDPDPQFMLTSDNAIFIPTRISEIVNVGFESRGNRARENINIHLRLKDFLDPSFKGLTALVKALEARGQLPFGNTKGHKWISKCPDDIEQHKFLEGADENWSLVVDAFASKPSQFVGDVFWRITNIRAINRRGKSATLNPKERDTNTFGSINNWHIDFEVDDINRYLAEVQNYIPGAEDRELPPNAVISAKEDTSKLLVLPERKVSLRRNATEQLKFGVSPIDFLEKEDAKLIIETEVDGHEGDYPPGSLVEITLRIAKNRVRLFFSASSAVVGLIFLAYGGTIIKESTMIGIFSIVISTICGYLAGWLYTNRIKIVR